MARSSCSRGSFALVAGLLAVAVCFALPPSASAARPDFARYDIILKRQPFGVPPVEPPPPPPPPIVQQPPAADAFIRQLRMCAITETPAGVRVGLVDVKSKPPKSYFLYVGDIEDGIELVAADYEDETAVLRKGSEEYSISMDGNEQPMAASTTVATATAASASTSRASTTASRRLSYADRLKRRREAEQERMRQLQERPQISPEELEKALQDYQMDVIRRGNEPPLPIPLTPEMDEQLVKEGVLPPLE